MRLHMVFIYHTYSFNRLCYENINVFDTLVLPQIFQV